MAITNGYTTLANIKALLDIDSTDATDDGVIESMVEAASRFFDAATGKTFYARTETRTFDLPEGRELWLDDDLLTVTTLTNGDGGVIPSTEYKLLPANFSPKRRIRLNQTSSYSWTQTLMGLTEDCISVAGTWGHAASAPADVRRAVETLTVAMYKNRAGKDPGGVVNVTPAGVLISPDGVPKSVWQVIDLYRGVI